MSHIGFPPLYNCNVYSLGGNLLFEHDRMYLPLQGGSRASVFAVIALIREYFIWVQHQYLTKVRGTAG